MNPDGREIPIVEDDMGEGYREIINENMTPAEIAFEKERLRAERSMKKIVSHYKQPFNQGVNNPVLKHLTKHK